MLRYILQLSRSGRSVIDPLPMDFGSMYYIYPTESITIKGFRTTGLREKIVDSIRSRFKGKDEMKLYRSEKIY